MKWKVLPLVGVSRKSPELDDEKRKRVHDGGRPKSRMGLPDDISTSDGELKRFGDDDIQRRRRACDFDSLAMKCGH
uniref:Uncharacterized protein n=1 Tax=Angiostrongylus cantonensis TaxID=6313 RepID=A0A0K0DBT8_ANGCA